MRIRIANTNTGNTREVTAPTPILLSALATLALAHPSDGVAEVANDALTWIQANPGQEITQTRGNFEITISDRGGHPRILIPQPARLRFTGEPPEISP